MLFNSLSFLIFLPTVFVLYWFFTKNNLKAQNLLILLASYFFYGWWDWRFMGLMAFSTFTDYFVSLKIYQTESHKIRKKWLWLSFAINLGMLGYFKYANFFIESWIDAWSHLGIEMSQSTLSIILPVGISFYTFQTLSYTIDVYRGQLSPTKNFINFAAFVSFFPQLVAGPIERASALLPQIEAPRKFSYEYATSGMRLIFWGMFKKVVVADSCAFYVNDIFAKHESYSGPTLLLGLVYFAFQIYGDFSGYSDIAIGTARLFGIKLLENFKSPFFSKSIPEFWNRWHISLNTWMNDYLFFPLAFALRRLGKWGLAIAVFVTFLVSGLWHGADWKFVVWGGIHGLAFMPYILRKQGPFKLFQTYSSESSDNVSLFPLKNMALLTIPFSVNLFAWIFFRANSIEHGMDYISGFARFPTEKFPITQVSYITFGLIGLVITVDWIQQSGRVQRMWLSGGLRPLRWAVYGGVVWLCLKNLHNPSDFIYFQF
jgi:alginate O-acetyltransferase complex protein AlgI